MECNNKLQELLEETSNKQNPELALVALISFMECYLKQPEAFEEQFLASQPVRG